MADVSKQEPSQGEVRRLRREIAVWKVAFALVLIGAGVLLWRTDAFLRWLPEPEEPATWIDPSAPEPQAVRKIIKSLRYSGVPTLQRPDVRLSFDFAARTWTLHNVHRFDAQGRVLLETGNAGLCGELAAYTFQAIEPLLGDRYSIQFVRAAEANYFPAPLAGHFVLRLVENTPHYSSPQTFILDPSFRRFGPRAEFGHYYFYEASRQLQFMRDRDPDETFVLGEGTPLLIRKAKQVMVGIVVEEQDGRFDPENHALSLVATRKHQYASRQLMTFRRVGGQLEALQNAALLNECFRADEANGLRKRLLDLFQGAVRQPASRGTAGSP